MRQPIAQYNFPVEKFTSLVDSSNAEEIKKYFLLHQDKYYTDASFDYHYQEFNYQITDIVDFYGEENLRSELSEYDREDMTGEDLHDFAFIKFLEQLKEKYATSNLEMSEQNELGKSFSNFIQNRLSDKKIITGLGQADSRIIFGPEIFPIFKAYEVSGDQDLSKSIILNHGNKIFIVKVTAYHPTQLMSYDDAYVEVKKDYIYSKALDIAKKTAESVVSDLQEKNLSQTTVSQNSSYELSQYSMSLRDKVIAQIHEMKGHALYPDFDYQQAFTLMNPHLDHEHSYKIVYQPLENTYKLLVFLPSVDNLDTLHINHSVVDNEKYGIENIDDQVNTWVDNAYISYYINAFHDLIDESFHYNLEDSFFDELASYHQNP
jgi:hypothetical protein